MNDIRSAFARQGLSRSRDSRVVAGVCSGIGRRLGLTPWVSRLLFVLLLMVVPGSQLLIYPVLWILMPTDGYQPATSGAAAYEAPREQTPPTYPTYPTYPQAG